MKPKCFLLCCLRLAFFTSRSAAASQSFRITDVCTKNKLKNYITNHISFSFRLYFVKKKKRTCLKVWLSGSTFYLGNVVKEISKYV